MFRPQNFFPDFQTPFEHRLRVGVVAQVFIHPAQIVQASRRFRMFRPQGVLGEFQRLDRQVESLCVLALAIKRQYLPVHSLHFIHVRIGGRLTQHLWSSKKEDCASRNDAQTMMEQAHLLETKAVGAGGLYHNSPLKARSRMAGSKASSSAAVSACRCFSASTSACNASSSATIRRCSQKVVESLCTITSE